MIGPRHNRSGDTGRCAQLGILLVLATIFGALVIGQAVWS